MQKGFHKTLCFLCVSVYVLYYFWVLKNYLNFHIHWNCLVFKNFLVDWPPKMSHSSPKNIPEIYPSHLLIQLSYLSFSQHSWKEYKLHLSLCLSVLRGWKWPTDRQSDCDLSITRREKLIALFYNYFCIFIYFIGIFNPFNALPFHLT